MGKKVKYMAAIYAAAVFLYLGIGLFLGLYRSKYGGMPPRSGPNSGYGQLMDLIAYPFAWPSYEMKLRERRRSRDRYYQNLREERLRSAVEPEYRELYRPQFEGSRDLLMYKEIRDALDLHASPPKEAHGFVLHTLSEAAAGMAEMTPLDDAADLLASPDAPAEHLFAAAAAARGVYLRGRRPGPLSAAAEDAASVSLMAAAYERALPLIPEAEQGYAALAAGTVYAAAARTGPPEDAPAMTARAREAYRQALGSGTARASLPAAVFLARLAESDEERLAIADEFLAVVDRFWKGWDTDTFVRPAELPLMPRVFASDEIAGLIRGARLLPVEEAGFNRLITSPLGNERLQARIWQEFLTQFALSCKEHAAQAEVTARLLTPLLPSEQEAAEHMRAGRGFREVPGVYFRLYEQTGDVRWSDALAETLLRLCPPLRPFGQVFAAEGAFLRGEYRRHIRISAEYMLSGRDSSSYPAELFAEYFKQRAAAKRIVFPQREEKYLKFCTDFVKWIQEKLTWGTEDENRESMTARMRRGELPHARFEFDDSDVVTGL